MAPRCYCFLIHGLVDGRRKNPGETQENTRRNLGKHLVHYVTNASQFSTGLSDIYYANVKVTHLAHTERVFFNLTLAN